MLVALNNKDRIEAEHAEKGPDYVCPNCKADVILRKGRVRIHHFAHKAASTCPFSKSESQAHYTAKTLFQKSYQGRNPGNLGAISPQEISGANGKAECRQ